MLEIIMLVFTDRGSLHMEERGKRIRLVYLFLLLFLACKISILQCLKKVNHFSNINGNTPNNELIHLNIIIRIVTYCPNLVPKMGTLEISSTSSLIFKYIFLTHLEWKYYHIMSNTLYHWLIVYYLLEYCLLVH